MHSKHVNKSLSPSSIEISNKTPELAIISQQIEPRLGFNMNPQPKTVGSQVKPKKSNYGLQAHRNEVNREKF